MSKKCVFNKFILPESTIAPKRNKKVNWLFHYIVFRYEPKPVIITVTSATRRRMHIAVEVVCAAVCDNERTKHIIRIDDQLNGIIDSAVDENAMHLLKLLVLNRMRLASLAFIMMVNKFSMIKCTTPL